MLQKFSKVEYKKFKKFFNISKYSSLTTISYIEKTRKYIKFIKWIPGIKMVGIGNSVSMNCCNENSDIDLFIVTKKNRLWLVRIITTFIFGILRARKTKKRHKNMFCLSFFTTTKGMDFSHIALKNDIYLYFWIIYLKPILDYDNTYNNFIEKNNSWADFGDYKEKINKNKNYIFYSDEKYTINSLAEKIIYYITLPFKKTFNIVLSIILTFINYILKIVFLPRTIKKWENIGKPFGVVITNEVLKFHDKDKRKKLKKELVS